MKTTSIFLALVLCFLIASCGSDGDCVAVKQPERGVVYRDTFNFVVFDGGARYDQCGFFIVSSLKRDSSKTAIYRPTRISETIRLFHEGGDYWGILEVLPEKSICFNGAVDPLPGKENTPDTMNFVNIVEFHSK
ncbi:MAG: hypothetical protein JST20_12995 [Bacteroidetes bacterium]|nr:hypothetical protein [Bacteroidota bacterium]